jgi:hypothetical protein
MRKWGLALAAILLLSYLTPASAAMRISEDRGGQIGHYLQVFAMLRSSGERVIIDGNCLSACTLVLGMIPRNRMCATPRARLGFHAAWMSDAEGRPVTSAPGTRALWDVYPRGVRHWIAHHGGLSRHMIYLQGRALYAFVPSCEAVAQRQAKHSRHHYATRHLRRYYSASAASDRR